MPRVEVPLQIGEAEEEELSAFLLEWSELQAEWDAQQLDGLFDFARDVALRCRHLKAKGREWSHSPGYGGVIYTLSTSNVSSLLFEMQAGLERLIRENEEEIAAHKEELLARSRARALRVAAGPGQGPVEAPIAAP